MTDYIVQVEEVSKSFRRDGRVTSVLDRVSFGIAPGESVALVGQSGSGKSTLGKIILGLESADEGQVLFCGEELTYRASQRRLRSEIQMIFQDPFGSLNPLKTIRYHLERPLLNFGAVRPRNLQGQIVDLLDRVGLNPLETIDKYPHELSGGQRQRVCIARAIAPKPKFILADEPTSMLDVSIRLDILKLLRGLVDDEGLTLCFITHDLASARFVADKTFVLNNGSIVSSGPTEQIINNPEDDYTKQLIDSISDPAKTRRTLKSNPHINNLLH